MTITLTQGNLKFSRLCWILRHHSRELLPLAHQLAVTSSPITAYANIRNYLSEKL